MGDRGAAGGYSGQQSMPNSGPRLRGWRSMRSKCPPSRSFHCRVLLSCFVVGGGLDLTLTISLAFHITSHWAVLVSVRQYAVLLLNMQVKLIHIATIYRFSLVQSEQLSKKTQKDKLSVVSLRTEKTSSMTVNSSPRLQRGWIKFRTRR